MQTLRRWANKQLRRPISNRRCANPDHTDDGIEQILVRPATEHSLQSLCALNGEPLQLIDDQYTQIPPTYIYQLNNARIHGPHGWVYTNNRKLLSESSWYKGHIDEMRSLPALPRRSIRLKGRTLSIASDFAANNYGHFLLDVVGRLALINECKQLLIDHFEHIVINGPASKWKLRLLERVGVSPEKLIWLDKQPLYCEQLIVSAFPARRRIYTPETVHFLREMFAPKNTNSNRRLFLVRESNARALSNQEELLQIASTFGFEAYRPEQSADSIADFAAAESVIGVHGAGLADIGFMRPGSHVLELMPSDHRHSYFISLGISAGLDYKVQIGHTPKSTNNQTSGPSNRPLSINVDVFRSYLESTFNKPRK